MKTPAFWDSKGWLSNLLLPLSYIYQIAGVIRMSYAKPARFPIPIICIGNLTAGGSGKTPVALKIGQILKEKNVQAFYLSRGYGGSLKGPVLVDSKKHHCGMVGDEPLLLASVLPTIVSKDRLAGARFAFASGAHLIIMDDGFQNPSIEKTLSLLVVDGKIGFGNGRLLPAGPLRETPASAIRRAHAAIILNKSSTTPDFPKEMLILHAKTSLKNGDLLKGKKIFAFCGLAYPQKFFSSLTSTGAELVGTKAFPDHHIYSVIDFNKLLAESIIRDAALVTTAKDAVRFPPKQRECMAIAEMKLDFDNPATLDGMINFILNPTDQ